MDREKDSQKNYVLYDSVISLSLVTETVETKSALYVMRLESLDEMIHLRRCNPFSDFCEIKESLFIIRHIRESSIDVHIPTSMHPSTDPYETSDIVLNYNEHFILQHMVSKKYLSKDKLNGNNNYQFKLVENERLAVPFTFKKIVDTRSTQNRIQFNQIIYLSVYIKEKTQYYYVNQIGPSKRNYNDYYELIIEKDFTNKFLIVNQQCYGKDDGYLYSGDLVNLIFQEKQQPNERSFMIGVDCQKEVKSGELISLKEEVKEDIDNFIKDNGQQGNDIFEMVNIKNEQGNKFIKSYNLKQELFKHINHFSFWIIEEQNSCSLSKMKRVPLKAGSFLRIKNPLIGLYLKIGKKPQIEGVLNPQDEYEFELCGEEELKNCSFLSENFQIFHNSINIEDKNLIDGGKYVIKSMFKDNNMTNENSLHPNYEPIALSTTSSDRLVVLKGNEFVFEIKKINIYKGSEAIYLKKIIEQLDNLVKSYNKKCYNQSNVIDVISKHLTFFTNYLMNLDYSFKDNNLETNYPVPNRQNLLRKFKILDIITQIICYFLLSVKKDKKNPPDKNDQANLGLQALMRQVLKFLTYLSRDNEKIKQEIFLGMKNILELCEYLFQKDRTILLDFIFVILKGSTALQEYVLGSNAMLINALKNRKGELSAKDKENLIHIDKIFSYLETSQNYLYFYKKIISFDKVTYKRDEIFKKIKEHMQKVENTYKRNKNIRNYKSILFRRIAKIIKIIRDKDLFDPDKEDEHTNMKEKIEAIIHFVKFFKRFDLNNSLFIKDDFIKQITSSNNSSSDYLDKKIHFIVSPNIKPEKFVDGLDIDVKSQLGPLYPLHFFNKFFPKVPEVPKENKDKDNNQDDGSVSQQDEEETDPELIELLDLLKEKYVDDDNINYDTDTKSISKQNRKDKNMQINQSKNDLNKSNGTLKSKQGTSAGIKNSNVGSTKNFSTMSKTKKEERSLQKQRKNNESQSTNKFLQKINKTPADMEKEKKLKMKLHKNLCIVYSIYQFCINQFTDSIYVMYKTLKNICVNYESFGSIFLIREHLRFMREQLFSKIHFIENTSIISNLYLNIANNPSVLKKNFDLNPPNNNNNMDIFTNSNALSSEEIYNIKFFFKFCRSYDKINFFLEKMNCFSEIRRTIPSSSETIQSIYAIQNIFTEKILKKLNMTRQKMLALYQSLNRDKEKLISSGIFNTGSIKAYVIQKRIKFVTNLLGKLDLSYYFDRIIYIKNDEFLHHIKISSREINNIREQIEKIQNENDSNKPINNNNNDTQQNIGDTSNKECIESIIISLDEITKQFRTFFSEQKKNDFNTMKEKTGTSNYIGTNFTEQMLIQENASYFRKINFPKILQKLSNVINSFSHLDKGNVLKLEYCKEILKIFNSTSKNFSNFHKLIKNEIKDYTDLIIKSLETVKNFISSKFNDKENESTVLSIVYNSAISFLYLIENSKFVFADMKTTMTRTFKLFFEIYRYLHPDLQVNYHLFYLYLITRVLLFLNKEKAFDYHYYEIFYQSIFPLKDMRARIIDSLSYLNLHDQEQSDKDKDTKSEIDEYNEDDKYSSLSNSQKEGTDSNTPLHKIKTDTGEIERNKSQEYRENVEKVIFMNFLSIYTIYLNELNSVHQSVVSTDKNAIPSLNFESLTEKIKLVLDTRIKVSNEQFEVNKGESMLDGRESVGKGTINHLGTNTLTMVNQFANQHTATNPLLGVGEHLITEEDHKNKQNKPVAQSINSNILNYYEFEAALLESIIHFKTTNPTLEIRIFKNNRYKCYNYNPEFMDIVLIEKILRNIELQNYLSNIFEKDLDRPSHTLSQDEEKLNQTIDNVSPLQVMMEFRCRFKEIVPEVRNIFHDYLQDQQIQSEMQAYLNQIKRSFTSRDEETIEVMKYFNYKKMNEMYPETDELSSFERGGTGINTLSNTGSIVNYTAKFSGNLTRINSNMLSGTFVNSKGSSNIKSLNEELIELDITNQETNLYGQNDDYYVYANYNIQDQKGEGYLNNTNINKNQGQDFNIDDLNNRDNMSVDLNKIFLEIMYLYPQYNKKLTISIYKSSFIMLLWQCSSMKNKNNVNYINNGGGNLNGGGILKNDLNFEEIITSLISLFNREINQEILVDKELFFIVINAISKLLKLLKKEKITFVMKNEGLFQSFFVHMDFIFVHLAKIFESIVKFMKNPESQKISEKFVTKINKVKKIIKFITNVLKFNSIKDVSILTEQMKIFNSKIVEQIIKLIFILLDLNKSQSNQIILQLIDFLNSFIQGTDLSNLNLLFDLGYFDLLKYIIKNINYHQIYSTKANLRTLHSSIDNLIEIEYKIMKIFFIFFNVVHNDQSNFSNYIKIRKFYEENFEHIKNKLKLLYCFSQKELEGRSLDIEEALLYYNGNDYYTEDDLFIRAGVNEENSYEVVNFKSSNKNEQMLLNQKIQSQQQDKSMKYSNQKSNDKCILKFEILLIYYTLYILQKEVSFENFFTSTPRKKHFCKGIVTFFVSLFKFIFDIIISPYYLIRNILVYVEGKKISTQVLYAKLKDIDRQFMLINENEITEYMSKQITSVEIYMYDIVHKVYFPVLTKCKNIKENPNSYIRVDIDQLEDYINHVLSNYDSINIEATENHKVEKLLSLPIIRFFVSNIKLFNSLSLWFALIVNFLILISYSTFNVGKCNEKNDRLKCPYFLYRGDESNLNRTKQLLWSFGLLQAITTAFIFFNYFLRTFAVQLTKTEKKFLIKQIQKKKSMRFHYGCCYKFSYIYLPSFVKSLINFESLYYILSLVFIVLGIKVHFFFYGFTLLELAVRINETKNVLLAIYKTLGKSMVTLLMFLVLVFYFALFALRYFNSHFPIHEDTNTFGKAYMRVLDQTFKQDGGVGTYLDKSLDPEYVPYILKDYLGLRFWFDNVFNFIIIVIILQIFTAIVKDYFSHLGENQQQFAEKLEKECLICGIDREKLEKIYSNHKNAFDIHINHDHNVSNYICYLNYLQSLTKRDRIIEENVWQMHLRKDYVFLPKEVCFKK